MKGVPTTCGSRILEGWRPPYDATVVQRLREAAGIVDPRQDQHGRVRDGLVDRALRLRPDAQPVGPRADPRRLGRRLGRGGGGLRGAPGDRHRHRRLDPPARRGHRHGRREADLRRRSRATAWWPSRRRSTRPGPCARTVLDAALLHEVIAGHDPLRLHVDRPQPVPDVVAAARRRRRSRHCGSGWSRSSAARATRPACAALRRGGRRAGGPRRRGRRGLLPALRLRAGRLLPDPARARPRATWPSSTACGTGCGSATTARTRSRRSWR